MKREKRDEGFRGRRNREADMVKYNVYRDANMVPLRVVDQALVGTDPVLEDLTLTNPKEYVYQVESADGCGNRRGLSGKLAVTPYGGTEWMP